MYHIYSVIRQALTPKNLELFFEVNVQLIAEITKTPPKGKYLFSLTVTFYIKNYPTEAKDKYF